MVQNIVLEMALNTDVSYDRLVLAGANLNPRG